MEHMAETGPEALRVDGWTILEDTGFVGFVGPFWQRKTSEGLQLGFLAEPKHRNRSGFVQGGMLATLADRTLGETARQNESARSQATIHLDLNYIDSAKIGEFVTAEAKLLRQTSKLAFLSGKIEAGGRLIATVNGIWRIRPGVQITNASELPLPSSL